MPNNIDNTLIKSAFTKFRHDNNLLLEKEIEVTKFIDTFVTCSSDPAEVEPLILRECKNKQAMAERAVNIAVEVNQHKHSRSCRKYGTSCRFHYPKYPSRRTVITKPPEIFYKQQLDELDSLEAQEKWLHERMTSNAKFLKHVKDKLSSYDNLDSDSPVLDEMKNKKIEEILKEILMEPEVQKELLCNEAILIRYEEALITSTKSAKSIILTRHPKDRYMNNYNPEWIVCWNANMDIQICLDFFQVVSYITDYYSKDDSGTIEYLRKAKKEMVDRNMVQQLRQMATTFLSHRRMGEAEAIYRVLPDMHLSDSNVKSVFVQTGWPENRYVFANKISKDPNDPRYTEDLSVNEIN